MTEEFLSDKLDELIFWLKYPVWKAFIADLKVNLKDDTEKLVYQLSTGNRSTRDVARLVAYNGKSITHVTVANLWQKWSTVPIVIKTNKLGRYKKVVSLRAAGIDYPKINFPDE